MQNVQIFKFDSKYTVVEKDYSYKLLNMMAEIGGNLGLFLGVSIYNITYPFGYCSFIIGQMLNSLLMDFQFQILMHPYEMKALWHTIV